jgi:hypothetical protein
MQIVNAKCKIKNVKLRTGLRLISRISRRLPFAFLIFNFAFFSACALSANKGGIPPQVQEAVDRVSDDMAEDRYEKIYNEAADEWREATTLEQSNATFKTLKDKLGSVKSRTVHSASEQNATGGTLPGHTFIIDYITTFDKGDGMETFTLVERDGRWQLARYFVNSNALK